MNDKPIIIIGLMIFVAAFTFPFWYNHLSASSPPKTELTDKAKAAKQCVAEKELMRRSHMQLLDQWRTKVVREGKTVYTNITGKTYVASLSNTCMDCHSDKAAFCDKCHIYASVAPYCWNCHTFPEAKK